MTTVYISDWADGPMGPGWFMLFPKLSVAPSGGDWGGRAIPIKIREEDKGDDEVALLFGVLVATDPSL